MFFSLTFFSIDLLSVIVNVDHLWYSSIFGVYFIFSGLSGAVALIILLFILSSNDPSKEVKYNIGKYFFTLNILWAYVAFSQYLIIWYGNLPDEMSFFANRMINGWEYLALFIAVFHLVLPFFLLISKSAKRKNSILYMSAIMVIIAYVIEIYWIMRPSQYPHEFSVSFEFVFSFIFILSVILIHPLRKMKVYDPEKL
jgi:formate-dependent nitrite reductase membrane component NrfD